MQICDILLKIKSALPLGLINRLFRRGPSLIMIFEINNSSSIASFALAAASAELRAWPPFRF
jgi:hypothetical protein